MCFPCPLMLPNSRRQVDLIMPQYWYDLVRKKLPIADETSAQFRPQFHRVVMTVGQILEAPFFKEYIKIGASPGEDAGNAELTPSARRRSHAVRGQPRPGQRVHPARR